MNRRRVPHGVGSRADRGANCDIQVKTNTVPIDDDERPIQTCFPLGQGQRSIELVAARRREMI